MRKLFFYFPMLTAVACGGQSQNDATYAPELLEEYRRAIPAEARLEATAPGVSGAAGALSAPGDAELAGQAIRLAVAVNRPARQMVRSLRSIVELPPSHYDLAERRFLWGPWDFDEGVGQVALTVTRNLPSDEFDYSYAFWRTTTDDLAQAAPVIAGSASPDANDPDAGIGVTVWDLELNHEFELQHDANYEAGQAGRGRFVMLYGRQSNDEGQALFNVAVFHDFVPEPEDDAEPAEPVSARYFYGRFSAAEGVRVDFVETEVDADLCDDAPESCFQESTTADLDERFRYLAYFVNRGVGRAEAHLSAGDLAQPVSLVECWDDRLQRTSFQIETDGLMQETMQEGSCTTPTERSAAELGLPSLDELDGDALAVMTCAAENGLRGCE